MNAIDPKRIVEQGYDDLDDTYRRWGQGARDGYRSEFLAGILAGLPVGGDVLEIGCGPGTDAAALAECRRYTGVDLSGAQLEHARQVAPGGTFLRADVSKVAFPPSCFDAVVAFYVFNHIPQGEMEPLFRRILTWLRSGGRLFASFGTSDNPGTVEPMWLGQADMYFSSLPVGRNDALLREVGFVIESADTVTELEEGEGHARFHWVVAQTPAREGMDPR